MHEITNSVFNDNDVPDIRQHEDPISEEPNAPQIAAQRASTKTLEDMIGWLTTSEVKELFKVSSATLYKWRCQNRLQFSQIGRKIYYKVEDLNTFLNIHYYKPHKI